MEAEHSTALCPKAWNLKNYFFDRVLNLMLLFISSGLLSLWFAKQIFCSYSLSRSLRAELTQEYRHFSGIWSC